MILYKRCLPRPFRLGKLPQESHIILEKQRQLAHAVLHHRETIHAHAKRKTGEALGIVIHEAIHRGVHHPRTEQLNPTRLFANPTAASAADVATCIHFRQRLGEWEITRTQADFYFRPKERADEIFDRSLEIAE